MVVLLLPPARRESPSADGTAVESARMVACGCEVGVGRVEGEKEVGWGRPLRSTWIVTHR